LDGVIHAHMCIVRRVMAEQFVQTCWNEDAEEEDTANNNSDSNSDEEEQVFNVARV